MKVGIVIPAYNEEKRIGNTLKEYSAFFENLMKEDKKFSYNILVSINNTKDKTKDIVRKYSKKNKRISYIDLVKGGKGYAVMEGFNILKKSNLDYIGFVDADNATSPQSFYDLIMNINGFDGIIASRYLPGSIVKPKQSLKRIISSRVFNLLIRSLFFLNYKDTQCGAKIFSKKVLDKVSNKVSFGGWSFDVELLYKIKKEGFKLKEYPTVWSDMEYSKLNFFNAGPKMVLSIIYLRIHNSPLSKLIKYFNTK